MAATGSCYVAQAGLRHAILLLQPLEHWDYECASPRPASDFSSLSSGRGWGQVNSKALRVRLVTCTGTLVER